MNKQISADYNKQKIDLQTLDDLNKTFLQSQKQYFSIRGEFYAFILSLHKCGYTNQFITSHLNEKRAELGEKKITLQYVGQLLKALKRKAGDKHE